MFGILSVSLVKESKEGEDADVVQAGHLLLQSLAALEGGNLFHVGLDRLSTLLLEGDGVHTNVVESSNLIGNAASLVLRSRKRVDQGAELFLVGLCQSVERAIAAVLGIQGVSFQPTTAGILIEIVHGVSSRVKVVQVDTRAELSTSLVA